MDYDAARFWWEVGMTLGLVANFAYQVIVARSKANRDAIVRVDGRVSIIEHRLAQLETDVRHLPDHEDLSAIHEKVNVVAGTMGEVRGELAAINRTLSLINEHLLNHGSRR